MAYIRKKDRDIWDYYLMYEELLDGEGTSLSFGEYLDRMRGVDSVVRKRNGTPNKNKSNK